MLYRPASWRAHAPWTASAPGSKRPAVAYNAGPRPRQHGGGRSTRSAACVGARAPCASVSGRLACTRGARRGRRGRQGVGPSLRAHAYGPSSGSGNYVIPLLAA